MFKRKTHPVIEDKINEQLSGDARKNALDFLALLRSNGISLNSDGDGGKWSGWAVGGTVGDSAGYMIVNGAKEFPGPWTFWFNSCDFEDCADDELKETAWAHASPCGHCNAGWENCGGGEGTIFGRKFERLCHSPMMFVNPNAQTVEHMKKLMLLLKKN
jgi:hypothetical protein